MTSQRRARRLTSVSATVAAAAAILLATGHGASASTPPTSDAPTSGSEAPTPVESAPADATEAPVASEVAPADTSAPATDDSAAPASTSADAASIAGLRVLIGNDDGVQPGNADGLFALRTALCAAGADVVVVAPWAEQSGTSASITFGAVFGVATPPEATATDGCADAPGGGLVYGVCLAETACAADSESATPSDAISLGINAVAPELGWTEGPDLVLVGINAGGNDGLNVPLSGTVGAASWAAAYGAPTIALSAKSEATPESLAADAEWTVEFVEALLGNDALPDGYLLAVNFPSPDKGPVAGVAWTSIADVAWGGTLYERDGDVFVTEYGECQYETCGYAAEGTDSAALEAGLISVTPVVVNRTAGLPVDVAPAQAVVEGGLAGASAR